MADIGAPKRILIVHERPTVVPAVLEPLAETAAAGHEETRQAGRTSVACAEPAAHGR